MEPELRKLQDAVGLGGELRRLRESAGLTIDKAAEALDCSVSKVSRMETGHVSATPRDVRDLLELYEVQADKRDALIQIAREAREKSWWVAYRDVGTLAGLEDAATSIRIYETLLVPGLLQTTEYARAVLRSLHPDMPVEEIERRIDLRMARQSRLHEDPVDLWAILDEAVLRRLVGGHGTMREQLYRITETADMPNVTLQVLPFSAGEHAGMEGGFAILGFPDSADPDIVYVENHTRDLYLEGSEDNRQYGVAFDHLRAAALKPDDSVALVARLVKEL